MRPTYKAVPQWWENTEALNNTMVSRPWDRKHSQALLRTEQGWEQLLQAKKQGLCNAAQALLLTTVVAVVVVPAFKTIYKELSNILGLLFI